MFCSLAAVESLPREEDGYIDDRAQGCRWVHSVFSKEKNIHCPHISFIPMEDIDGKTKCQSSAFKPYESLFSEAELDFFYDWGSNEFGFNESFFEVC